jgi:hypothetical protein
MSLTYEIRPRKDRLGVDLICGQFPFDSLWYAVNGLPICYARRAQARNGSKAARVIVEFAFARSVTRSERKIARYRD